MDRHTLAEIDPASERCQRWQHRRHSFVRTSDGGFDPRRYTIEPLDLSTARSYVETHHYAGTYVADRFRYGLYHHTRSISTLVGVAVFGVPVSRKVLTNVFPDLEPYRETVELSRFVLEGGCGEATGRAPANSESWFLARCFTELTYAGIRGVVSFADPVPRHVNGTLLFPGHIGTIYQASNATYTGRSTPRTLTVLPDGTTLSARAMQKVRQQEQGHEYVERRLVALGARAPAAGAGDHAGWLAAALAQSGAVQLRHRGNHRYVFALGATVHERGQVRIHGGRLPYPKRPTVTHRRPPPAVLGRT